MGRVRETLKLANIFASCRRAHHQIQDSAHSIVMDTSNGKHQFHLFHQLPWDVKICILVLATDSSMMRTLPFVSKHWNELCLSDGFWQGVLELLVKNEPFLWRRGLSLFCQQNVSSPAELVRHAHKEMHEPGYFDLYQRTRSLFLQFSSPAFPMPAKDTVYFLDPDGPQHQPIIVMNGKPAYIPLSPSLDERLFRFITNGKYLTFRWGQTHFDDFDKPRFLVFYDISPHTPPCLMKIVNFTTAIGGDSALVYMAPICHVKIQNIKTEPNQKYQIADFLCLAGQGIVSTQLREAHARLLEHQAASCSMQ